MPSSTRISTLYRELLDVATREYSAVVTAGSVFYSQSGEPWKLRVSLCDGSFIDVYYSVKGKYSYHWDRRLVDGKIYRHDNAPHHQGNAIAGYPKHFHDGSEQAVASSDIPDDPHAALRYFLRFASEHISR